MAIHQWHETKNEPWNQLCCYSGQNCHPEDAEQQEPGVRLAELIKQVEFFRRTVFAGSDSRFRMVLLF